MTARAHLLALAERLGHSSELLRRAAEVVEQPQPVRLRRMGEAIDAAELHVEMFVVAEAPDVALEDVAAEALGASGAGTP